MDGPIFGQTILSQIKRLVEARLSYDPLNAATEIPSTWLAKMRDDRFLGLLSDIHSRNKMRRAARR